MLSPSLFVTLKTNLDSFPTSIWIFYLFPFMLFPGLPSISTERYLVSHDHTVTVVVHIFTCLIFTNLECGLPAQVLFRKRNIP